MQINHIAIENNWNLVNVFQNAKTLILGSFNPFNPNGDNTDYYYGRYTNYFWRALAEITNRHPNYFFNHLELKLEFMVNHKFCFLDVINSIEILSGNNQEVPINNFVQRKILTEFSDQVLFTTRTTFEDTLISVTRTYNNDIIPILQQGNIQRIIHTMGNNTIGLNFETKWKENNFGINGFQGFINSIRNLNQDIDFVAQSYSPSGRAVKVGGQDYLNELKIWLNENLNLN